MSLLSSSKIMVTIAVNDLENAQDFYEVVLGLKRVNRNSEGIVFDSGGGLVGIYESTTAGSNSTTSAWWTVDNVEAVVKDLKKRGITFERKYDLPHAKRKGDIYLIGKSLQAAWFKDPDGNVLGFGNY